VVPARSLTAALLASTLLMVFVPRGASSSGGARPETAPAVRISLTDATSGRLLFAGVLSDGERAVLTWTNSLFRLPVTETFEARGGHLELVSIRYGDPSGCEPPRVRPEEVEDLYQTGGPFLAEGLAKRVERVVFRVGEVGRPTFQIGGREIRFFDEVGFGGAVQLLAR
jgi:hypothetical protein